LATPRQTANSHLASCVVSEVSFIRIAPQRRKILTSQSSKTAAAEGRRKATSLSFLRLQPQERREAEEKIPDEFQQGEKRNFLSNFVCSDQYFEAEQCSKTPQ